MCNVLRGQKQLRNQNCIDKKVQDPSPVVGEYVSRSSIYNIIRIKLLSCLHLNKEIRYSFVKYISFRKIHWRSDGFGIRNWGDTFVRDN